MTYHNAFQSTSFPDCVKVHVVHFRGEIWECGICNDKVDGKKKLREHKSEKHAI